MDMPEIPESPSMPMERLTAPVPRRRGWEVAAVLGLLLLAAGLRLWHLGQNGFGHPYYAATVRSMIASWHNFWYASFDPAGFISVDKPPVAFWIQAILAKLIGYGGYALHIPQALEGVIVVGVVYGLVRRTFGAPAGLIAGLVAAVAPVSVAVERSNLPDACLVMFLVLAAWALSRAVASGRTLTLLLAMALVGVAFNVKLTAACVVLPKFCLVYFVGAPVKWWRRLLQLSGAGLVFAAVALSWSLFVDLTPAEKRPFVGDTQDNSMLTMAAGTSGPFSGIGRVLGGPRRPGAGGPPTNQGGPPDRPDVPGMGFGPPPLQGGMGGPPPGFDGPPPGAPGGFAGGFPGGPPAGQGPPGMGRPPGHDRIGFGGPPGVPRLFAKHMAEQILWLLPLVVLGLATATTQTRWRWPLSPQHQALLLWGGWLFTCLGVFSYMQGVIHNYYLVLLTPPVAALAGVATVSLYRLYMQRRWLGLLLPLALSATVAWEMVMLSRHEDWRRWLMPWLLGVSSVAVLGLIVVKCCSCRWQRWRTGATVCGALGLLAILICPAAWALMPVMAPGNRPLPMAYPELITGQAGPPDMQPGGQDRLIAFLRANRSDEQYVLMTRDIHTAAPLIVATGEPVIAVGGFTGNDPALTLERFKQWVADGRLRFVLMDGFGGGPGFGPRGPGGPGGPGGRGRPNPGGVASAQADIFAWVRAHGQPVPTDYWTEPRGELRPGSGARGEFPVPGPWGRRPPPFAPGGPGSPGERPVGPGVFGGPPGGPGFRPGGRGPGRQLYDCRPERAATLRKP